MNGESSLRSDLVKANRILAHEGILDALGHVSIRDPENAEHFIMSRMRSPELVETTDLVELNLDGSYVNPDGPKSYSERYIHAAVYAVHPAIMAVCHSHTVDILPFTISTSVRLQSVIHNARFIGTGVDVWDIADEFGKDTNLLVQNLDQARSLISALGNNPMILMRGHGCVVIGNELHRLVDNCVYMAKNARVQVTATLMGSFTPLYPGECEAAQAALLSASVSGSNPHDRPWEYYTNRAGLA